MGLIALDVLGAVIGGVGYWRAANRGWPLVAALYGIAFVVNVAFLIADIRR